MVVSTVLYQPMANDDKTSVKGDPIINQTAFSIQERLMSS